MQDDEVDIMKEQFRQKCFTSCNVKVRNILYSLMQQAQWLFKVRFL